MSIGIKCDYLYRYHYLDIVHPLVPSVREKIHTQSFSKKIPLYCTYGGFSSY